MQQPYILLLFSFFVFWACDPPPVCHSLVGTWKDGEGREILFLENGTALWLTRFGSQSDTIHFAYHFLCQKSQATLDWTNFSSGPYFGKNIYGILEWLSDSSFQFRYEAGTQPDVRPKEFDTVQTLKFTKK
jgi:hypothetical protein